MGTDFKYSLNHLAEVTKEAWGTGLHSLTFQLNLSRVWHTNTPYTP